MNEETIPKYSAIPSFRNRFESFPLAGCYPIYLQVLSYTQQPLVLNAIKSHRFGGPSPDRMIPKEISC